MKVLIGFLVAAASALFIAAPAYADTTPTDPAPAATVTPNDLYWGA